MLGLKPLGGGDYEVVSGTGRYLSVVTATAEDAATKAIIDPYVALLTSYNETVIGQTTAPIDTTTGFHPGNQWSQSSSRCIGI